MWLPLMIALAAGSGADSLATVASPAPASAPANAAPTSASAAPAAPADTSARIPGAAFKLGWSADRAATLGSFRMVSSSADSVAREGDCRWFGNSASARLTYRDGRLTRAVLTLDQPPPYLVSYAIDEMRRAGYRRTSLDSIGGAQASVWVGRARATLSVNRTKMTGNFSTFEVFVPTTPAGSDTIDFTQVVNMVDTLPPPQFASRPPSPDRPPGAVQAGVFGRVMVGALVDTSGAVAAVRIDRGISELNDAALAWAQQVRYRPYVYQGRPTWFRIGVSVSFSGSRGTSGGAR
jgi:TonB family protein